MTISRKDRLANMEAALKLMLGNLGENSIGGTYGFMIDGSKDDGIYPTTWTELESRGLIVRPRASPLAYRQLTGSGWLEALKVSGKLESPEMKKKVGKIMAAMKALVKSRQGRGCVCPETIAERAGVSVGFV